jgi:5'-nucleotidase
MHNVYQNKINLTIHNRTKPPMPNILVSNDDGIYAPGLLALALAMRELGKVWVVAPETNQSITGHKKTLDRPLRAKPVQGVFPDDIPAFAVDGAPSDCVALTLLGLFDEKIDFVASGINSAPNLGQDLTYSGTVSVALETAIFGLPAIAFSLADRIPHADYDSAAQIAARITAETLKHRLPHHTILNVNIPHLPLDQIKGYQITRQGLRDYRDVLNKRLDPRGLPYYWIGGAEPAGDVETEGTDIWAVHHGYVSITPVHLDLTRHEFIESLRAWDFPLSSPQYHQGE